MCTGAGPGVPCLALLLLGLGLSTQARPSCVGDTYPGDHRCCRECQPGSEMASRCDHARDTECRPCAPGFYNDLVNYEACKPCTQCNRESGSELWQECSPTQDTICRCRPGTQPQAGYKPGVDCEPCPEGHFSEGNNQKCRPWTDCSVAGKRTLQPASSSSDAVCEDRDSSSTRPRETHSPAAQPTTAWPRTTQGPLPTALEPSRGSELAIVLSLGLGLGLLAPLAALLAVYLPGRTWRNPKPPGGSSFRTPVQEEQAHAHSAMAKI
ncbi:tumor necrosis factor receptor superfamily member 4 [Ochotona princeps]|uniref:tumor necrosis factor receptor superfamily member 4 n=1 Tax=Ochotona princeps TaxID=9978 RepID=UPI00032AF6B9|nr:tumor necrosis factor receptor superfamily member 4 [Ochotona princeps]